MIDNKFPIEISNLTIGYKNNRTVEKTILNNVNAVACSGELVALMGSNGSGKSTLLRTISGFQQPLDGLVTIGDKPIHQLSAKELSFSMSYVSTDNIRVGNMTVYELVSLGRYGYTGWFGKLAPNDCELIQNVIELVGLNAFENRLINSLSDGERQRCMIARALAQDTPVILLDEPTAFLDVKSKYEIVHLLHMLARDQHKTILFSTHDFNIALNEADKIWLINEDRLYQGAPEDLVLSGIFEKLFANETLSFDYESGDFKIAKQFRAQVKIEAEGTLLVWTLKALERKGFVQSEDAQIIVKATMQENNLFKWNATNGITEETATNIYDLCEKMNSFVKPGIGVSTRMQNK